MRSWAHEKMVNIYPILIQHRLAAKAASFSSEKEVWIWPKKTLKKSYKTLKKSPEARESKILFFSY
jgi:hypothetical protein